MPAHRKWLHRQPDIGIALLLLFIAVLLMLPYILQPNVLIWPRSGLGTDFLHYRWSAVYYLRRSLEQHGQFPLWYGDVMGGTPIPGNPSMMLFYPIQLLIALLPIPILWGFAIQATFHLWLAGIGGYTLAHRAIGLGRPAALICGLAMLLAPRLSSNLVGDVGMAYAMTWAPLCLAWAWLTLRQHSWRWPILAGIGLACQYLIHVHIFFFTAWVIGMMFAYNIAADLLTPRQNRSLKPLIKHWMVQIGRGFVTIVVCAGLVALNLLPFISYMDYLSRETLTLSEASHYSLPPFMLIMIAMPNSLKFPEWELYVGLLPLALAPLSVLHSQRRITGFWILLIMFAALFSLGDSTPLFALMFYWIPGFNWLRVPPRMWYFGTIALVMLFGLAIDALLSRQSPAMLSRQWQNWLTGATVLLAVMTVFGRFFSRRSHEADWLLGFVGCLGLLVGFIAINRWLQGRISVAFLIILLGIGLILDLLPVNMAYMSPHPTDELFEVPAIGSYLLQDGVQAQQPFRVYSVRHELPDHIVLNENLQTIEGMNSFQFEPYVRLVKLASGCNPPGFFSTLPPCISNEISPTAYRTAVPNPTLLGLLNVRYAISPVEIKGRSWIMRQQIGEERLYENQAVMPRAFGIGQTEVESTDDALWTRLPHIDPRQLALTDTPPDTALSSSKFFAPAESFKNSPNMIHVRITLPSDGILIVSEIWTPGWKATDNGQPTEIMRVNGALRGIYLDSGAHEIIMTFMPGTFRLGLFISLVTALICVLILLRNESGSTSDTAMAALLPFMPE